MYILRILFIFFITFSNPVNAHNIQNVMVVDIGNTRTKVVIFTQDKLTHSGAFSTKEPWPANKIHQWMLKQFKHLPQINCVIISSVVPSKNKIWQELGQQLDAPVFFITATNTPGITFSTESPNDLGSDRIAGLVGAAILYPNTNLVIVDMGTATTINLLTQNKIYLGGAILTGAQTSVNGLTSATALLPSVNLKPAPLKVGKNTHDQLQLNFNFYSLGLKEIIKRLAQQAFEGNSTYKIIGTGGYAQKFKNEKIFDHIQLDLKFLGARQIYLDYSLNTTHK